MWLRGWFRITALLFPDFRSHERQCESECDYECMYVCERASEGVLISLLTSFCGYPLFARCGWWLLTDKLVECWVFVVDVLFFIFIFVIHFIDVKPIPIICLHGGRLSACLCICPASCPFVYSSVSVCVCVCLDINIHCMCFGL